MKIQVSNLAPGIFRLSVVTCMSIWKENEEWMVRVSACVTGTVVCGGVVLEH